MIINEYLCIELRIIVEKSLIRIFCFWIDQLSFLYLPWCYCWSFVFYFSDWSSISFDDGHFSSILVNSFCIYVYTSRNTFFLNSRLLTSSWKFSIGFLSLYQFFSPLIQHGTENSSKTTKSDRLNTKRFAFVNIFWLNSLFENRI